MDNKITIRNVSPNDLNSIVRIVVDGWKTAYKGIMKQDFLDAMTYESRIPGFQKLLNDENYRRLWFVAETDNGEILGFVSGGKSRDADSVYDGELYAIYVRAEHQGNGFGAQLMRHLMNHLTQEKFNAMKLWVLTDNQPSRRFYERMNGALTDQTQQREFGGEKLLEVAYAWPLT
ncbi:MAG: N-acetyltransferase family protein [Oligoflexales bacterium]